MTQLGIDRLRVEGFRGITGVLDLDLRSPLTLLYAANGTGKTTLCDAVEWLLTGCVDRLGASSETTLNVLYPRFAPGLSPRVDADLRIDGQPFFLERRPGGARGGTTTRDARTVAIANLLERLAPEGATSEVPQSTIPQRRQWLRGTRFLMAESLASLFDTDAATVERRNRVFADILGVRSHLDARDRLRRYSDLLQPREGELDAQVRSREDQLRRMQAVQGPVGGETTSATEWGPAEDLLGLPRREADGERAEVIAGEIARRRQAIDAARRALDVVERDPIELGVLRRQVDEESLREQAVAPALEEVAGRLAGLKQRRDAASTGERAARQAKDDVTEAAERLSRLLERLSSTVDKVDPEEGMPAQPTYGDVRERIAEARLPARRRNLLSSEVTRLVRELPEFVGRVGDRQAQDAAIADLHPHLPQAAERERLATAVVAAESGSQAARSRVAANAKPLQNLRAAADAFVAHSHDGPDCPVCGHDWGTRQALDDAIKAVREGMPAVLAAIERDVVEADEVLADARRLLSEADEKVARLSNLEAGRDGLTKSISAYEDRLRAIGVDPTAPDLPRQLRRILLRVDVASAFSEAEGLRTGTGRSLDMPLVEDRPLPGAVAELGRWVAAKCAEEARNADSFRATVDELLAPLADVEREQKELGSTLEVIRETQAGMRRRLGELTSAWRLLNPGEDVPDVTPQAAGERLARAEDVLAEAGARLAAGNAAADQAARRQRSADVEAELSDLRTRLDDVRSKRQTAGRAMAAMQAHYLGAGRRQLNDLIGVVNPLFSRMHANRVFDRIELGEGDDLLNWRSVAGGNPFKPSQDFSQGQKQDLALALFIARAMGLRGTFFLDEPVTHLDDVNRVGLLDVLRATVLSSQGGTRLVVTTSSRSMARHVMEKFDRVARAQEGAPPTLRVYEIKGNGRIGIECASIYPRGG